MINTIKDLESGDFAIKELRIANENLKLKDGYIYHQDSIIGVMETNEKSYLKSIKQYTVSDSLKTSAISSLNDDLQTANRKKNLYKGAAVATWLGIIVKFIFF
jgi:hypothetical protein